MQKKFVIINNDNLLNDLIEEQVSIVFESYFNIKFFKSCNINILNELDIVDLTVVNYIFIRENHNILMDLKDKKKSKVIILFDDRFNRSQLKKYNNYNFVVKPFKLKQLIDIIKDFFVSYETHQKILQLHII